MFSLGSSVLYTLTSLGPGFVTISMIFQLQ